jgi:hypothetical protein
MVMNLSAPFGPREHTHLLFQGTTFELTNPASFLPEALTGESPKRCLVLEDTSGGYYVLPAETVDRYALGTDMRDALQRSMGSESTGYGHFNPHNDPPPPPPTASMQHGEGSAVAAGPSSRFFQGGLFSIPASITLPEATAHEMKQAMEATALVLQDDASNFYVVPAACLRRHAVPREMNDSLIAAVGLSPPHAAW